jgi:hypothetical protein
MNSQKILNTMPIADFSVQKKRNIKLLVFSDYKGAELTELKNSITNMKSGLANDARIAVEYEKPEVITIGSQQGKYKENTWGMLGHLSYTWSGSMNEGTYDHKQESASFSYSPTVILPEGKEPASIYQVPTSCSYSVKSNDGMFGGGKDRVYSFYNGSGLCAGTYSIWLEYSYLSGSGGVRGSRSIDTEPEFTYDDFWSIYSSRDVGVINTVTGWDLSKVNYSVPEGTEMYVIFAMNDSSTNYYNKSGTYLLGQLRGDENIGRLVNESSARVYSICDDSLENVNLSANAEYHVAFSGKKQDISLKELISRSYDGRSLGSKNVAGLVKNIRENIRKPAGSIDMLIATDKSKEDTDSFVSNLSTSLKEDISLKTSVVNNTEVLYNWDKPVFSPGLRLLKKYISGDTTVFLFLSPSGELWGIQESLDSGFKYYGLNNQTFTKITDNVEDACIDSLYNELYILKKDGTVWTYKLYEGLKRLEGLEKIKKIQTQRKYNSYGDKSVFIAALDNDGYMWHIGYSEFEGDEQENSGVPTKMHFKKNGSIVDFSIPQYGYGGQGSDYTMTIASKNNEVWEMHSGYICDPDTNNWVKAPDVYKGIYNNQPLSDSLWQSAVHTEAAQIPVQIDPNLQITDLIRLDGWIYTRYIGVDTKNRIYLIGGMSIYSFNEACSLINTDMDSIIQKEKVQIKAFPKAAMLETPLREGSDRYFVYISDSAGADTSKSNCFPFSNLDAEMINYLKENNFNIYVVTPAKAYDLKLQYPYVPETRQTVSLRDLVSESTADSAFCADIANVIKIIENRYSAYVKQGAAKLTLIAGEEGIGYNLVYNDFENDPRHKEKWQYTHDASYFDNSNGTADYSGKWLDSQVDFFDKVGKYTVVSRFRDNPKEDDRFDSYRLWSNTSPQVTVIVHRRPYASFSTQIASKAGAAVKLSYLDQSYDPDHNISREDRGITARSWQYKKVSSNTWINGRPDSLTYNSGIYQIKLNVKDMEGAWSKAYIDTIDTADLPPSINADPSTYNGLGPLEITITASDHGENDFSYMRYAITRSTAAPTEAQWVRASAGMKQKSITINSEGTFYLHMEAYDAAGQIGKKTTGTYIIESIKAGHFYITMILDPGWRPYYFDTNNGIDDNSDGKIDRYQRLANTDIGTISLPVNYYNLIGYTRTYIKAGYKVKGRIDIHGEPDWAGFNITYIVNKKTYTDSVTLTKTSGDTYTFEWIIPLETDSKTFISFDLLIKKDSKIYGNENWSDNWNIKNTSKLVFYINGRATDDIIFMQSQ